MKKKILFLIIFICSLFLFNQNVYADEVELYPYKLDYADIDFGELPKINGMTRIELVDYLLRIFNENVIDEKLGIYIENTSSSGVIVHFYSKEKKFYNYYLYNQNNNGNTQDCLRGKISYRNAPIFDSSFDSDIDRYIGYIKKGVDSSFESGGCSIIKSGILESASTDLYFPLYSTLPVYYTNIGPNPSYNSNVPFVYNNNVILYDKEIPTYFSSQYSDLKDVKTEIFDYKGFYTYQVPLANINDLRVDFDYDVADKWLSYFSNNDLEFFIYAKISEVDYNYSKYSKISSCEVTPNVLKVGNHYSGTFTFNCPSSVLSKNYDYLIINFVQQYSLPISNVKLTTNYGKVFINDVIRDSDYIYDSYTLNKDDKLLFSSARDETKVYFSKNLTAKSLDYSIVDFNNTYVNSNYDFLTYKIGSLYQINYSFGKTSSLGLLVQPYYQPDTLNLMFYYDQNYVSISNKDSLTYFFNGSWRTGYRPISNPSGGNPSMDISGYFGVVTNFIDSFSTNINDFSAVLQNIYNLAPSFLQTFIFVVFILSMTYILYEILRK